MLCSTVDYAQCECDVHGKRLHVPLTVLLLDCWQREYDERPYKHFHLNRTFFENRLNRPFNKADCQILVDFLSIRKLESVRISHIPGISDGHFAKRLAWGLLEVEEIQLKGVALSIGFLETFLKAIANCKVKSLDLSQNDLSDYHLHLLRRILIESTTLTRLNVASCSLNENKWPILADGVHKSKSIRCLDISRGLPMTLLSLVDSPLLASTIAQLIWQNKLTELHLRQCFLDGHDMEPIAEYLALPTSSLLILDLNGNYVGSLGTEFLFDALARSKTLRDLDLGSNSLGPNGGLVIARQLPLTALRSLDITHNKITTEMMCGLLVAVKKSCELKVLKMYGNQFDLKCAHVLRRLLKAKVLDQGDVDVTCTWDHVWGELRVIPAYVSGRVRS